MTYILPNYFLEEKPQSIISTDHVFTLAYTSKQNNDKVAVRNVMHAMILLVEGSKRLQFTSDDIMLNTGDIFLLTQGNYYMSDIVSKEGGYKAILAYFDDTFVMDFIKKYQVNLVAKEKEVVFFTSDAVLQRLMHSYEDYVNQDLDAKNEIIKLKTEEIFLHLLSQNHDGFCSFLKAVSLSSKDRIRYILEANVDLIQSVEDMCKLTRTTKSELRQKMQQLFAMHPKEWLDAKRLAQAAVLLATTDNSITSIATSTHYSTASWFGVQFKKKYAMTPKQYREQNR
jgi:AraC-like DNA-binding protein